jgi:hypothetical protein
LVDPINLDGVVSRFVKPALVNTLERSIRMAKVKLASLGHDVFLTSNMLRERYGHMGKVTLVRRLENDPAFPRPIRLGRMKYWKLSDLESFERTKAVQ